MFDRVYFDQVPFDWPAFIPPPVLVTRLLHVRHPALLTVIHKRGEQTIKAYGNLSSLDAEYLTGQVGLHVIEGDIILATTLPGIEYKYEVR